MQETRLRFFCQKKNLVSRISKGFLFLKKNILQCEFPWRNSSDMFQPIISNLQSLGLLYKSYCLFLFFVHLFLSYLSEHNVCSQYVLLPRPCFGFWRDETITFLSYHQLFIACKVLAEIPNYLQELLPFMQSLVIKQNGHSCLWLNFTDDILLFCTILSILIL